jgi:hypothetical protein
MHTIRHLFWHLIWNVALASSVLWGCAYALVDGTKINQREAAQVEQGIQKFRALDFTAPVPLVVKTRDEAEQIMIEEIERDHTDAQLRIGGRSGAMTGLYPPGMDLKAETLKLLRDQIAGFYDPERKQMVLVAGVGGDTLTGAATRFATHRDVLGEMLLAHELTHALQDQHFHIDSMLQRVKDSDDETLALKSVAEGDATIAGFGYAAGRLNDSTLDLMVSHLKDLPQTFAATSHGVPVGISTPLLFQYSDGVHFVAEAWKRGGWAAVDALYRHPPLSSQQIMQPALYFEHPSPPAHIGLAGYEPYLPAWNCVDDDTYGELLLKVILQRNLPADSAAANALARWAGDRMFTLQKGDALALLWIIAFHDEAAARDFARAYTTILDRLPGEPSHRIVQHQSAVLVEIGGEPSQFDKIAEAVWRASTIQSRDN